MPYFWNHTITYDAEKGSMPYLVQRLTADDLRVDFDYSRGRLDCQMNAYIGRGAYRGQ